MTTKECKKWVHDHAVWINGLLDKLERVIITNKLIIDSTKTLVKHEEEDDEMKAQIELELSKLMERNKDNEKMKFYLTTLIAKSKNLTQ